MWGSGGGGGVSGGPNGGGGSSSNWTPNGTIENGPALVTNGVDESNGVTPNTNTAAAYIVYFLTNHGYPLTQTEVNYLVFNNNTVATQIQQYILGPSLGNTLMEKAKIVQEHVQNLVANPSYLNDINNLTGNWWDKDQDGYIAARKIEANWYLQANPNGFLDCQTLSQIPSGMTQSVSSYQIPASVTNRINQIRTANAPAYSTSNFKLQQLQDALGLTVNCDYFWVKFNVLPYITGGQWHSNDGRTIFGTIQNSYKRLY